MTVGSSPPVRTALATAGDLSHYIKKCKARSVQIDESKIWHVAYQVQRPSLHASSRGHTNKHAHKHAHMRARTHPHAHTNIHRPILPRPCVVAITSGIHQPTI
jgi:hypothetical protein